MSEKECKKETILLTLHQNYIYIYIYIGINLTKVYFIVKNYKILIKEIKDDSKKRYSMLSDWNN